MIRDLLCLRGTIHYSKIEILKVLCLRLYAHWALFPNLAAPFVFLIIISLWHYWFNCYNLMPAKVHIFLLLVITPFWDSSLILTIIPLHLIFHWSPFPELHLKTFHILVFALSHLSLTVPPPPLFATHYIYLQLYILQPAISHTHGLPNPLSLFSLIVMFLYCNYKLIPCFHHLYITFQLLPPNLI